MVGEIKYRHLFSIPSQQKRGVTMESIDTVKNSKIRLLFKTMFYLSEKC